MLRLVAVAAMLAAAAAAAQEPPAPPAAPTAPSAPAAPAAPAALTPEQIARDPRMIAAIRHANLTADHKCGDVGGIINLEQKAAGRACRKRMVDAAKLDAEAEITAR